MKKNNRCFLQNCKLEYVHVGCLRSFFVPISHECICKVDLIVFFLTARFTVIDVIHNFLSHWNPFHRTLLSLSLPSFQPPVGHSRKYKAVCVWSKAIAIYIHIHSYIHIHNIRGYIVCVQIAGWPLGPRAKYNVWTLNFQITMDSNRG